MADKKENCVIHYDTIFTSERLTKLSQKALDTLVECKAIRESLGGKNRHKFNAKKFLKTLVKTNTLTLRMLSEIHLRENITKKKTEKDRRNGRKQKYD